MEKGGMGTNMSVRFSKYMKSVIFTQIYQHTVHSLSFVSVTRIHLVAILLYNLAYSIQVSSTGSD
eukprot:scaffold22642_cov134-Cylindrotheca_fusiformis.AAC.25